MALDAGVVRATLKRPGEPLGNPRALPTQQALGQGTRIWSLQADPRNWRPVTQALAKFSGAIEPNFQTKRGRPSEDEGVNPRIAPFGRRYFLPDYLADLGMNPPGVNQLAICRKARPIHGNPRLFPTVGRSLRDNPMIPGDPTCAVTPHQWNLLNVKFQVDMCNKNVDDYRNLRGRDLFFGPPEGYPLPQPYGPEFGGYFMDGVVNIERGLDGSATQNTEGFRSVRDGYGTVSGPSRRPAVGKFVQPTQCGTTVMADYWDGRGIDANSRLFFVLRKFDFGGADAIHFDLAQKNVESQLSSTGFVSHHRIELPLVDGVRMRPWMLAAVAMFGNDGFPSHDYQSCVDEWGMQRGDGLILPVARVVHANKYGIRAEGVPPTPQELQPLISSLVMRDAYPISVYMNPEDGLLSTL
jgi:hypothetical protein